MAIILEQHKKPMRQGAGAVIFIGILVLAVIVYVVFFGAKTSSPSSLSSNDVTGGITKINIDEFGALSRSSAFTSLTLYPPLDMNSIHARVGKQNPFQR
ncbi:MAG: hypothetical protein KGI50_00770 [Patescibacteria group bacterium]|nr:hypothetical protein [Patescibacteria group bacterium]MDE2438114.1 hypothetical protein [Patescibacteria group bacterium]